MAWEAGAGHIVIGRMLMRFGDTPDAWVVLWVVQERRMRHVSLLRLKLNPPKCRRIRARSHSRQPAQPLPVWVPSPCVPAPGLNPWS